MTTPDRASRAGWTRRRTWGVAAAIAAVLVPAWWWIGHERIPSDAYAIRDCGFLAGARLAEGTRVFAPWPFCAVTHYPVRGGAAEIDPARLEIETREGARVAFRADVDWSPAPDGLLALHDHLRARTELADADAARTATRVVDAVIVPAFVGAARAIASEPAAPDPASEAFAARVRDAATRALLEVGIDMLRADVALDLGSATRVPRARTPRDVFVLGLDGADWDLLDPMLARGELPHLADLVRRGARARLRTVSPILSPVVWTSVATGKRPEKHGIFDFLAETADGRVVPVTRTLWRARPIWDLLGESGVDVAVTGWWATWPAEPVRGYMATDRVSYERFRDVVGDDDASDAYGKTWPPALYDEVRALRVDPAAVAAAAIAPYVDLDALGDVRDTESERLDQLETIVASVRTYERVANALLDKSPGGFHALYWEATDTVAHLFMPFHPPPVEAVASGPGAAARIAAFGGAVEASYREADAVLGRIVGRLSDAWTVVVLSDHGFKHGDNRPTTDPRVDHGPAADWHDRFGVLILAGPGIREGITIDDATVLDVAPTLLAMNGVPVPDDFDGRVLREAFEADAFEGDDDAPPVASYEVPADSTDRAVAVASADDAEIVARLRALGYVGDGPGSGDSERAESADVGLDSSRAHNNRGIALLAAGDVPGARAAFLEGLASGGGAMSLVNLARVDLAARRLADARDAIERIEHEAPGFTGLAALRGWLADAEGDADAARVWLERAVEIDPSDSRSLARLGNLAERDGRPGDAEAFYRRATRADPENAEAFNYLGNVLHGAGRLAEAERAYRGAIAADPKYPGGYNNLGLVLHGLGDVPGAERVLRDGLEQAPASALLHNSLGSVLFDAGRAGEAESAWRQAVEADPSLAEAWSNLGISAARRGDGDAALEALGTAVEVAPAYGEAWFNLGKATLVAGDRAGAFEAFARSADLRPAHFESWVGAGEVALAIGRAEDAVRYLEGALALRPDSARVAEKLAVARAAATGAREGTGAAGRSGSVR